MIDKPHPSVQKTQAENVAIYKEEYGSDE